jgi:hypothetical protein
VSRIAKAPLGKLGKATQEWHVDPPAGAFGNSSIGFAFRVNLEAAFVAAFDAAVSEFKRDMVE